MSGERKADYASTVDFHEAEAERVLRALIAGIKAEADLAHRFALALSVPGVGKPTAALLVVTMPELGEVSRGEIAALAGLAPYDCASGDGESERHIAGGRARPRQALFAAAMVASLRWNPALVAMRKRLEAKEKRAFRSVIVACARKLLVQINAVLARGTPWVKEAA